MKLKNSIPCRALNFAVALVFTILYSLFTIHSLSAAPLEIDYMEYNTDANAQNAYVSNSSVTATGGTITEVGGYRIHTFTASGTFTMNVSTNVEALVVAGGGSGGTHNPGGGGAGGLIYKSSFAVIAQDYTVTIGAGGAGQPSFDQRGNSGSNSVFGSLNAFGGGAGGGGSGTVGKEALSGGSGGGASIASPGGGTTGQGNSGGNAANPNTWAGGGGGGAGAVGSNGSGVTAGKGGDGLYFFQFAHAGSPSGWFAGGGGGGSYAGGGGIGGQGGQGGGTAGTTGSL